MPRLVGMPGGDPARGSGDAGLIGDGDAVVFFEREAPGDEHGLDG
jgi:hypothetical protein